MLQFFVVAAEKQQMMWPPPAPLSRQDARELPANLRPTRADLLPDGQGQERPSDDSRERQPGVSDGERSPSVSGSERPSGVSGERPPGVGPGQSVSRQNSNISAHSGGGERHYDGEAPKGSGMEGSSRGTPGCSHSHPEIEIDLTQTNQNTEDPMDTGEGELHDRTTRSDAERMPPPSGAHDLRAKKRPRTRTESGESIEGDNTNLSMRAAQFGNNHFASTLLFKTLFKGMEHVPNIFMSFDKYLFLEVINILI